MHCTTTLLYVEILEGSEGSGIREKNRKFRPNMMGMITKTE
jgi:hypothetical protein